MRSVRATEIVICRLKDVSGVWRRGSMRDRTMRDCGSRRDLDPGAIVDSFLMG